MKWFKHYADNHRGKTIQNAFDKMGYKAYAIYVLMEICSEKLEGRTTKKDLKEDDFIFTFNATYLRSVLRLKSVQIELLLSLFSQPNWLSFSRTDQEFTIKMPILLELLNRDEFRTRQERATYAQSARLEKEKEKEKEVEEERTAPTFDLFKIWNDHCGSLQKVVNRNAFDQGLVHKAYLKHTDLEWIKIMGKVARSSFCQGKNKENWKANFQWLIKPGTSDKILNGNYDDPEKVRKEIKQYEEPYFIHNEKKIEELSKKSILDMVAEAGLNRGT